jgi:hypothetical protein
MKRIIHPILLIALFFTSNTILQAQNAIDLSFYLPIDHYNGQAYQFMTSAGAESETSYQTYEVVSEGKVKYLIFKSYDKSFNLTEWDKQKVTPEGLIWIEMKNYYKAKGGKTEEGKGNPNGIMILPWQAAPGFTWSKQYSLRSYYNDTYGYRTYVISSTRQFMGIQTVTINGTEYECAVVTNDMEWYSQSDSGQKYPGGKASWKFYYAKGYGYIKAELFQGTSMTSVMTVQKIMSVDEFKKMAGIK